MTVDQVIKFYGGPAKAQRELGYTLQTFRDWRKRTDGIPLKAQGFIAWHSGGKLKAAK